MKRRNEGKKESVLYELIKKTLENIIRSSFNEFHLEITANKKFSNKLKSKIPQHREIIFNFLKEAAPDITGYVKGKYSIDFLVVEVKNEKIKLEDIYQTRKYAELFDARIALLISTEEIPEEIKRLSRVVFSLLSLPAYKSLTIARFDIEKEFVEWFPENPFLKSE